MSELYYDTHIFCCQNQREAGHSRGCCADKGASELRDYMKERCKEVGLKKTRVNSAGCLDRCELGPVMVIYPQGIWYHYRTKADVDAIILEHLQEGRIVERLILDAKQKRLIPTEAVIELSTLNQLRDLLEADFPQLIASYLASAPAQLQGIRDAISQNNPEQLAYHAHPLKSSSQQLGAHGLAEIAKDIETLGRNRTIAHAEELLREALQAFEKVRIALES